MENNKVLLNETIKTQKPQIEMQNITHESRRHECNKCGKSFSQVKNLYNHIETEHISESHSCSLCDWTILKKQKYLIEHLKLFHKNYNPPEKNIEQEMIPENNLRYAKCQKLR